MATQFNEMTRVQFAGLIHLMKLGYDFIPRSEVESIKDPENNILIPVLKEQFFKLNSNATEKEFDDEYKEIKAELTNNDLGKEFYNRIQNTGNSKFKFIDWDNWDTNILQVLDEDLQEII